MPCFHPMRGYRSHTVNENGKRPIVFKVTDGFYDMPIDVPCGQCIGCRLEYSRQWAMRCIHELKMHEKSCFLTLTYNDENLPLDYYLEKEELQKALKRIRKYIEPLKFRYMACGEYGETTKRPHYHVIMYGYEFPDNEHYAHNDGYDIYTSKILDSLWGKGECKIGTVTFESCCYVARYMLKKQKGQNKRDDGKEEFLLASRKPGLGQKFFEKYYEEIYATDSCVIRNKQMKPPKYYDTKFEEFAEKQLRKIKAERRKNVCDDPEERQDVKEQIQLLKQQRIKRL